MLITAAEQDVAVEVGLERIVNYEVNYTMK